MKIKIFNTYYMIDRNDTRTPQYSLMNIEFNIERGYSYGELLQYLRNFQHYYRECYRHNEILEINNNNKDKTISDIETKIEKLESYIKDREMNIESLYSILNRKLTIWERITGKIKI